MDDCAVLLPSVLAFAAWRLPAMVYGEHDHHFAPGNRHVRLGRLCGVPDLTQSSSIGRYRKSSLVETHVPDDDGVAGGVGWSVCVVANGEWRVTSDEWRVASNLALQVIRHSPFAIRHSSLLPLTAISSA